MLNTGHRVRSVQGGGHHHRSTGISCCARREKKQPSREIRALGAAWTVSAFFRKTRSAAKLRLETRLLPVVLRAHRAPRAPVTIQGIPIQKEP